MGCAQAKPGNQKNQSTHQTNPLTGSKQSQGRDMIKFKQTHFRNEQTSVQIQQNRQLKQSKTTSNQVTQRVNDKQAQNTNNKREATKKQTNLQQSLQDKNDKKSNQNQHNQGVNDKSGHSISHQAQRKHKNTLIEQVQQRQQGESSYEENANQISKQQNTEKSKLQKSKDVRNNNSLQPPENLDYIVLGVESKVQNKEIQFDNKKQQEQKQKQNPTKSLKRQSSQKRINQTPDSKKPFNHNLFYSQHQIPANNKPKQQDLTQKENKNTILKQQTLQQYGSYFEQPIPDNKSVKTQNHNKQNHSLTANVKSPTNSIFNKKTQFYSVLENKKSFDDRFNNHDNTLIDSKISIKKQAIPQERHSDFLIQEHDQQGVIRPPLETSYHAPSKRTIQTTSNKILSSSSSKIAQKYVNQLQNQPITQRADLEKDQQISDKHQYSLNHKKQSKLSTAFFKTSSEKYIIHIGKQQSNDSETQKMKISSNKKAGPILFSQISFKDKQDSDQVPEQGNYANSLQMSVHLNIADHF